MSADTGGRPRPGESLADFIKRFDQEQQAMTDLAEFRRQVPEWDDIPDELVVKTLAYNGWLLSRRVRELGRLMAEELRLPQLLDWCERRLRRET